MCHSGVRERRTVGPQSPLTDSRDGLIFLPRPAMLLGVMTDGPTQSELLTRPMNLTGLAFFDIVFGSITVFLQGVFAMFEEGALQSVVGTLGLAASIGYAVFGVLAWLGYPIASRALLTCSGISFTLAFAPLFYGAALASIVRGVLFRGIWLYAHVSVLRDPSTRAFFVARHAARTRGGV